MKIAILPLQNNVMLERDQINLAIGFILTSQRFVARVLNVQRAWHSLYTGNQIAHRRLNVKTKCNFIKVINQEREYVHLLY